MPKDSSNSQKEEEFQSKLVEMQAKNEKQIKYIRQVGDMQKNALEKKITQLESDLKNKDEEIKNKRSSEITQQSTQLTET